MAQTFCHICGSGLAEGSSLCPSCGAASGTASRAPSKLTQLFTGQKSIVPSRPTVLPLAVGSLVFSMLSFVMFPFFGGLAGIIAGHAARKRLRKDPLAHTGDGMALGGLILGYVNVGLVSALVVLLIFVVHVFS